MKKYLLPFVALLFFIAACKPAIKSTDLYGTWKYIKVENPNASPPDSVGHEALVAADPSIRFTKDDSLIITWGGKVLSHGKFTLAGSNIQYKEDLPGGKRRQFPFYISKITNKDLVFETLGEDGTKVTAIKK
jgi:hypothetical protein